MFDIPVRKRIDPYLEQAAGMLASKGLTANTVTWLGFLAGMGGAACIVFEQFVLAFVLIGLNRIADGLDGCIARSRGPSDLGGFLDIALDMIFYASVPFAFALVRPENHLPAAFLLYSYLGTGTSFLAFAVISAKRGNVTDEDGKKGFFYSTGLIEGTETAVFLLLLCVVPGYFGVLAWTMGTLCWMTTGIRLWVGVRTFR